MLNQERGTLTLGSTTIPYEVVRSRRRKRTLGLSLEMGSGLSILVPEDTDLVTISRIVEKRSEWLHQKIAELKSAKFKKAKREFINGESILYLGRQYRLHIIETPEIYSTSTLKGKWLTVNLGIKDTQHRENVIPEILKSWYTARATKKLPERAIIWSTRLGVNFNKLLISNQQNRWGSCDSKHNLRINWRVMMAPISLIDYVLAHEICHLLQPNHSRDFWHLLGSIMPDYERRKNALKELATTIM